MTSVSPRLIRRIVVVIFALGAAGIIVGSITNNAGFAITMGLITAVAAIGLMLVTAVVPATAFAKDPPRAAAPVVDDAPLPSSAPRPRAGAVDETIARDVEARIEQLVADGADEAALRRLVSRAVDLGRSSAPG